MTCAVISTAEAVLRQAICPAWRFQFLSCLCAVDLRLPIGLPGETVLQVRFENAPLVANFNGSEIAAVDEATRGHHTNTQALRDACKGKGFVWGRVHDVLLVCVFHTTGEHSMEDSAGGIAIVGLV